MSQEGKETTKECLELKFFKGVQVYCVDSRWFESVDNID